MGVVNASSSIRWRQTSETQEVIVSHNVTNYEFFYEPFYVARDDVPAHDERFLGYGFTRNTQVTALPWPPCGRSVNLYVAFKVDLYSNLKIDLQVYEMALGGWSFQVLSPIFSIHWGLQMKQRRRPSWRKTQMDANRRLFDTIHNEIKVKYGHRLAAKKSPTPSSQSNKLPSSV